MRSFADSRRTAVRWAARLAVFTAFTATVVALAGWPGYRHLDPDRALVKISLRHTGVRVGECRELSAAELERLPQNMRTPLQCPRERSPIELEVDINGRSVVDVTLQAQGLHADGRAVFYRRLLVPAGTVAVAVRMKDDVRQSSFAHRGTHQTRLEPGQALIVDFDSATGSFVFL